MSQLIRLSFGLLIVWASQALADDAAQDYHETGKAWALGRPAAIHGGIGEAKARSVLPEYSANPAETAHFGLTDLVAPRQGKITGCGAAAIDAKSRGDQECIAVNFMQNAKNRPQFNIDPEKDPTITRSGVVLSDPSAYAGNLEGSFTDCETITTALAPVYEKAVCNEYPENEIVTCRKRAVVTPSNQLLIPPVIRIYQTLRYTTPAWSSKFTTDYYVTIRADASGGSIYSVSVASSSYQLYGDAPNPDDDRFELRLSQSNSSQTISCTSVSKTSSPPSPVNNAVTHSFTYVCNPASISLNLTERLGVELINSELPQTIYDHEIMLSVLGYQKLFLIDSIGAYIPHGTLLAHTIDSGCNGTLRIDNLWGVPSAMCGYGALHPFWGEYIVTDTFTSGANTYSGMLVKFLFDPMIDGKTNVVSWINDCAALEQRSQ